MSGCRVWGRFGFGGGGGVGGRVGFIGGLGCMCDGCCWDVWWGFSRRGSVLGGVGRAGGESHLFGAEGGLGVGLGWGGVGWGGCGSEWEFTRRLNGLIGEMNEACVDRMAFVQELQSVAGESMPAKTAVFLEEMMNKEGSRE
ncbi:hypothetical protein Tco_1505220 [Tanacetum coccineum]